MPRGSGDTRGRRSRGGRGRRGVSKRRGAAPRPKDQLQLDYELDLLNAERDGRDVEQIKIEYRLKREAARKEKLDKEMDSYFDDQKDQASDPAKPADMDGPAHLGSDPVDASKSVSTVPTS
jgi:hypothetical protein